jgi:hypothetical protein
MRGARLALALAVVTVTAVAAVAPAQGATPILADTWDYRMQSTTTPGRDGRFTGWWNFERPNIMRLPVSGFGLSRRVPMRPRSGWLVGRHSVLRKCFRVAGGKQNYYRSKHIVRLKLTRVHDMEGEQVASAARLEFFNAVKPCIGRRLAGWFKGTVRRRVPPEHGGADISYEAPDGCQPTLIDHSANEDNSFTDWNVRVFSYLWTFSDGGTSTKAEPRHAYPAPGNHSATVLIRSINGAVAKGTETIEVSQPDPDCN